MADKTQAAPAEMLGAEKPLVKRNTKDTVFRDLFNDPRKALELYSVIHPEDTDVTLDDLTDVTIENVITDQEYNDLGMTIRGKLLLLLEAQSTWTFNIIVRILLYLAHTWNEHLEKTKQDRYGSKKLDVLKEYLTERGKEVVDIMMALFDEQKVQEQFGYGKMQEGEMKRAAETVQAMWDDGVRDFEKIARYARLTVAEVKEALAVFA